MKPLSILLMMAGLGLVLLSAPPGPAVPGDPLDFGAAAGEAPAGEPLDRVLAAKPAASREATGERRSELPGKGCAEQIALGMALFQAKGCTGCHVHGAVNLGAGVAVGPDLTELTFGPGYPRAWLGDPASIRTQTLMPDLGLSGDEIEALIAFINNDDGK